MGKAIRSASMNGSSEVFTWGLSIRGVVLGAVLAMGAAEAAANTLSFVTYPAEVRETMGTSRAAVTVGRDAALGAEAYRLSVTPERIVITCAANAGREVVMCPRQKCYLDYPTGEVGVVCPYPRFCEKAYLRQEAAVVPRVVMGTLRVGRGAVYRSGLLHARACTDLAQGGQEPREAHIADDGAGERMARAAVGRNVHSARGLNRSSTGSPRA